MIKYSSARLTPVYGSISKPNGGSIANMRGDIMIYINSRTRIRKIDDKNLQIEVLRPVKKRGTKEEKMEWMWDGYYTRLEEAFLAAFRKGLLNSAEEEHDAKSVIEYIEMAKLEIMRAIESTFGDE